MTQVYDYTPKEDEPVPLWDRANVRIVRMETQMAQMQAQHQTELAGMLRTEVEHAKAIHVLQHQVEALQAKMDAWEADS